MQLYKINEQMQKLLDYGFDETCVDPDTGEIVVELAAQRLAELEVEESEKIEGIALYIKQLTAESGALKQEADILNDRRKAKDNKAKGFKLLLGNHLTMTGREKFETAKCALSFRKSESVQITSEADLLAYALAHEDNYLRYKDPEIDKTAIKSAIKSGVNIPGAELVQNQNLQIK